ncbi:MAG: hypothetical protein AAB499_00330 [Patescibacteria group bacterium]
MDRVVKLQVKKKPPEAAQQSDRKTARYQAPLETIPNIFNPCSRIIR